MDIRRLAAVGAVAATALLVGSPAVAEQGDPALKSAAIDVQPGATGSSTQVREMISLGNVERGIAIENKVPVLDGAEVSGITVVADGRPVQLDRQQATDVDTLSFSAPSSGALRYEVRYGVTGGASQVPIVVPAYPGADAKVVDFRYHVPDGYYLQPDAFPAASGSTGTLTKQLTGVPTLIDYEIGTSPPGALNVDDVAGAAVIVLIAALSVWVFRREARDTEEGAAHV
jgi:hypothetical protein